MKVFLGPYTFDGSKRNINIDIDNYDVWDMHDTLSIIIVPMLEKIKQTKYFYPQIEDVDLPDSVKTLNIHQQWKWFIDELLWAFTQRTLDDYGEDAFWKNNAYDYYALYKHRDRIKNAFRLFGKYFLTLGD